MESSNESMRLDKKTRTRQVQEQALWAGIKPGQRVADLGCGSGKTTAILHSLTGPEGETVGIDIAAERISFAGKHYRQPGITFEQGDIRDSLDHLGTFDFIWVRFVLEYYRSASAAMVEHITSLLNPGGILCLIDLDHNCLNHYSMDPAMENTLKDMVRTIEEKADFDPYAGRKLYSYLYDLGYERIDVQVGGHHVIFGASEERDEFNWMKKIDIAPEKIGYDFKGYEGGYAKFKNDFRMFFQDPRRFTYSPIICCRGEKKP